jgi:Conserved oligomeric complex COG6
VRLIHGNCRALLRGTHQRAGLELMDAMALHQEAAYERLCRCGVLLKRQAGGGRRQNARTSACGGPLGAHMGNALREAGWLQCWRCTREVLWA